MKLLSTCKLAGLFFSAAFLSNVAQATLLDHGSYFHDSETKLDWLDLTVTQGATLADVTARLSSDLQGWRFATADEYRLLTFGQEYLDIFPASNFKPDVPNHYAGELSEYFLNKAPPAELLSPDYSSPAIRGFVGLLAENTLKYGSVYKAEYDLFSDIRTWNQFDELDGVFLVRGNVPEPTPLLLLLGGLTVLVLRKRIK